MSLLWDPNGNNRPRPLGTDNVVDSQRAENYQAETPAPPVFVIDGPRSIVLDVVIGVGVLMLLFVIFLIVIDAVHFYSLGGAR